jgi:hypothetical protein
MVVWHASIHDTYKAAYADILMQRPARALSDVWRALLDLWFSLSVQCLQVQLSNFSVFYEARLFGLQARTSSTVGILLKCLDDPAFERYSSSSSRSLVGNHHTVLGTPCRLCFLCAG